MMWRAMEWRQSSKASLLSSGHARSRYSTEEDRAVSVAATTKQWTLDERSVVRFQGSEVEPDLMVRTTPPRPDTTWDDWPVPALVVEVLSASTRRRDPTTKRNLYTDAAIPDYWIVD